MTESIEMFEGASADLPRWLARLHRWAGVGDELSIGLGAGDIDTFPLGLARLLEGAGFEPVGAVAGSEMRVRRLHTLPDWVGPEMSNLIVGLNPSPASADGGVNFARPGNRFWPAALTAGLATVDRNPEHALGQHGLGFTDLVKRTTRTAAELTTDDYRSGMDRLEALAQWLEPGRLIIVGLAGWRAARNAKAAIGWQPDDVGGRPVYLMPNTSGLNAHTTLAGFVDHFRAAVSAKPG